MKKNENLTMKMEDLIELVGILKVITDSMRTDHDAILSLQTRVEAIEKQLTKND